MDCDPKQPRLTTHDACAALTRFTLEHLPRDPSFGRSRKLKKGAYFWHPDDRSDRFFILNRGQVAVLSSGIAGHEVIIRIVNTTEVFGELCFCSQHNGLRENSARAVSDCDVLEVELGELLNHLREDREALTAVVFTFCERLADTERRLEVLSYRGAEDRLARLLLQLAAADRKLSSKSEDEVKLVVSHERLAAMAAMTRPHVTVTMNKLRERGLVHYRRGTQLGIDVERLTQYFNRKRSTHSETAMDSSRN